MAKVSGDATGARGLWFLFANYYKDMMAKKPDNSILNISVKFILNTIDLVNKYDV